MIIKPKKNNKPNAYNIFGDSVHKHKGSGYQAQTASIKETTVYHLFIHQKTIGRYDCNLLD